MGRQVQVAGATEEPTFQLMTTHGKADYLYRFFGPEGRARVEVLKEPFDKPSYLVVPPGVCTCPARVECKHKRTVDSCQAVWPLLVRLAEKAGGAAVQVDVAALAHAMADVKFPAQLGGGPE